MKVTVVQRFRDKNTGQMYPRGAEIEVTEDRFAELKKAGRLVVEIGEITPVNSAESETTADEAEKTEKKTTSKKKATSRKSKKSE